MYLLNALSKLKLYQVNKTIVKTAKSVGVRFINNSTTSCVNVNTILGDDVSFNGMRIIGHGNVTIGSRFHCAEGCYIITDNHDYDNGREIPYDHERSMPRDVIAGGHPAKVFKYRDLNHYEKLKREKAFLENRQYLLDD